MKIILLLLYKWQKHRIFVEIGVRLNGFFYTVWSEKRFYTNGEAENENIIVSDHEVQVSFEF